MTAAEVAAVLRIETINVVRLCREKKIRATRPGKAWLITEEAVEEYLASGSNDQDAA